MARRGGRSRGYDVGDRVGETIRRILADELVELDDDRLTLLTISGVDVDNELSLAKVWWSAFDGDDEAIAAAFGEHAGALRKAVASRTRLRRTPRLEFAPDPGIRQGERIDEILRDLHDEPEPED